MTRAEKRVTTEIFDQAANAVWAVYISLLNYISQIVLP